jgi:chitodextrinase
MPTFIQDSFTDAAGTLLENHVGETGAQYTKHPSSNTSTASISAQGRLVTSGNGAIYLASGVPATADYDVAWDLVVAALGAGSAPRVCGRMDATANTYYGLGAIDNGAIQFVKVVAGAVTSIGYLDVKLTVGQTPRFVLEMRGTSLRVLQDGVEKFAVTDADITAAGRVGLRSTAVVAEPGLHIDNLSAADSGTAPVDTTPPAVPTGLAATPGDAQVALSWTANTESDLAGYRLYRDGVGVYDGAAATFTDTTVTNGTAYSYAVSAYDTSGNESAQSTAVQATPTAPADTTPPAVPTGLTAAPGDAQVSLDWDANTEPDLAGYRLYRDSVQVFDGAASAYLDSTAVNGTTYSYAVSAYDTSGNVSAQSVAVQATPVAPGDTTPPAVPTGLAATVEPTSVTLGWDPNAEADIAGYRLRRDGTVIYDGALASFTDTTAPAGEKVSYTVAAYDTAGNESGASASVAVTTMSVRRRYAAGGLLSALSLDTPDGPVTLLAPGSRGVHNAEGFAGMATRVITTARAGRHGSVNRTRHRQDRQITWEGTLQSTDNDPDRVWWEYQQIARALASAQDEDRELHYTLGQGLPLFARVRLEELSAPIEVGPNAIKYQAVVRAADPRGYSAVEQTAQTGPLFREDLVGNAVFPLVWPVTFAALTTGALMVYNDGTVGTPPTIELDGYLRNPVVQLGDRRLVFVGEIAEGDTLTIDTDERTVMLNGTANRRGLLNSVKSRWFELPPYPARVELLPEAFSGAGGLRVRFRDAIQ